MRPLCVRPYRGRERGEGDPPRNQGGTAKYSPLTDFVGQGRFLFSEKGNGQRMLHG